MSEVLLTDRGAVSQRSGQRERARARAQFPWAPVAVIGAALAVVGLADVALVWYPLSLGNPEWEFGVLSRTFNGLALATIGLAMLMVLALYARRRTLVGIGSFAFTVATVLVVLAAGLYLLVLPVAWGGAPAQLKESLGFAIGKTLLYMGVYLCVYGFMAVHGWKRFGALRKGETE